jgi:hypothetical protein
MTATEIQKRNEKAQNLRVLRVDDTWFYVESDEGKIMYKVCCAEDQTYCTCGDFAKGVKTDPNFRCKHVLAVINCLPNDMEKAEFLEKRKPKLDERFIKEIDGQDFVKYAGLLDLAHQKRLISLEVELLQFPSKENEHMAISRAKGTTATGEIFSDVGDANPLNCNSKVGKHIIRMASTRAKARVLRDLTNIGMTCLEELGDLDDVIGAEEKGSAQRVKPFTRKQQAKVESAPANGNGTNGTSTQSKAPENASNVSNVSTGNGQKAPESAHSKPEALPKETKPASATSSSDANASGNNGQGKAKETKVQDAPKISEAQKRAVMNLSRRRGISVEEVDRMSSQTYGVILEQLSASDASAKGSGLRKPRVRLSAAVSTTIQNKRRWDFGYSIASNKALNSDAQKRRAD